MLVIIAAWEVCTVMTGLEVDTIHAIIHVASLIKKKVTNPVIKFLLI